MQIIAHRGSSYSFHENTMPAFEGALVDGADAIEFDVRLTRDRRWVVYHDAELTTDGVSRPIASATISELKSVRIGQSAESIPTLEEFLAWSRARNVPLIFDIKDRLGIPEFVAEVEAARLEMPAVFSSFHRVLLRQLETARPEWPRGLIVADPRSRLARRMLLGSVMRWAKRHRISSLHFEEHWVTPSLIARVQGEGIRFAVWTVDDPVRIAMLSALGVDAVITNRPDLARITLRDVQVGQQNPIG